MAAATITAVAIGTGGYNLTDQSASTTLVAGAGNGVKFLYNTNYLILLINESGDTAVYTLKAVTPAQVTAAGGTVNDKTISVADGKTYLRKPDTFFKDSNGYITIECDQAADVLVVDNTPSTI